MKNEQFGRQVILVFLVTLAIYAGGFAAQQWWRGHRGPWEVTYMRAGAGRGALEIRQRTLGIERLRLLVADENGAFPTNETLVRFDEPTIRQVPAGEVVFLDTTYLPGTVTMEISGQQIEILPRTLRIGREEIPWHPDREIDLTQLTNKPAAKPDRR